MAFLDFSGLSRFTDKLKSLINEIVGNTAMGTTATTLTGAIAEHSTRISSLESIDSVLSVDGILPGLNGNVDVGALTKSAQSLTSSEKNQVYNNLGLEDLFITQITPYVNANAISNPVTFDSSATTPADCTSRMTVINKIVCLRLKIAAKAGSGVVTVGTIVNNYKPSADCYVLVTTNDGETQKFLTIGSGGNITLRNPTEANYYGTFIYFTS